MDKPKITPKDFFLWTGAMVALYISVFSLITLLFEYINYAFPDVLDYNIDPYSGSIRFAMASLIVLFPAFLILMRLIRNDIAKMPEKRDLWIRRWALFLTVFVAGTAIVADLITLINYFLGGDLTTRFELKVAVVLLVAGAGLLHFLADVRGYWVQYPSRAQMVGAATGVLILVSIVAGFFIMGSPNQIRLYRLDEQKVNDLQNIQSQVTSYYQAKQKLPAALDDINTSLSYGPLPVDRQTGKSYEYQTLGALSFKLCATFNAESRTVVQGPYLTKMEPRVMPVGGKAGIPDNWQHGAGQVCFDRTIDPSFYPPLR